MSANKEFVKFDKVDKSYDGKVLVVKDLQLNIAEGEFVTMLGPSGSGKTTCLMMLAGFETPTNGEIYLDGNAISSIPPHKRGIGMVFQNYALFPHMTVYENLAFPLRVRKIPKDEADNKIDKALSMVSLQGFAARMPGQLSGGQQQRVAVARSLVFDPQLVLMDEPLGALDKNLRESMQYEIKHIHESIGVTVVYVTHDQGAALTTGGGIVYTAPAATTSIVHSCYVSNIDGTNSANVDIKARATSSDFTGSHLPTWSDAVKILSRFGKMVSTVSATSVGLNV